MKVYNFKDKIPKIHKSAFIHDSAVLIGEVIIGPNCFIGPNVTLRGDAGKIIVMANSNIQDNCVAHSEPNENVVIHSYARVGHSCVLHGCEIKTGAVIGMGSILMDSSVIGENALIGAGSLVRKNQVVKEKALTMGTPAIFKRDLSEDEMKKMLQGTLKYIENAKIYKGIQPVSAIYFEEEEDFKPISPEM